MAEHHLDEKVIGVAFDGTGYGDDGNIWGGEFLVCDLADYRRVSHFEYLPLPGGDLATEEPWRTAVSYVYKVFGKNTSTPVLFSSRRRGAGDEMEKADLLVQMIDKKINCPLTSSAGRLFDAVSSLLGLCQVAAYPAQGPMLLESLVRKDIQGSYGFAPGNEISFSDTISDIIKDINKGIDRSVIATKFHNTIISVIFETAERTRKREGLNKVGLSGGVFQNKYLLEGTIAILEKNGFIVYTHAEIPSNDGGIALGQLAVASKRRELTCV